MLRISTYPQAYFYHLHFYKALANMTASSMPSSRPECEVDIFSNGGEWKWRSHQLPQTTWLPLPSFHLCSKQTLVAGLYNEAIPLKSAPHLSSLQVLISTTTVLRTNAWKFRSPKKTPMQMSQPLWAVSETILFFKVKWFERQKMHN